ncbi:rhodanese-like domain-containing protein [Roseateles sp. BYS78W]|uniref:Rhodanese-like domain-containing protein n=1 Tax=Pelomonas candidula TaxID=3299025 RepID=A0ABW7HCV6_9BURK
MLDALQRWLQRRGAASSPLESATLIEAVPGNGTVLIDVRTAREHQGGTLVGAINVPLSQLDAWIATAVPDRERPIQLFCASGSRSEGACRLLRHLGYQDVHNAGGLVVASARLHLPIEHP